MKNERIIEAWDKIEPDSIADACMLDAILARNQAGRSKIRKVLHPMNKALFLKRLAPAAACLVLAIAAVAMIPQMARQPSQTQNVPGKLEEVSLPAMLAGQKVTWQNLSVNETEPQGDEASWYITVLGADGLQINFGSPDTKPVGTLADGRKVILATEEVRREEAGKKNASKVIVTLGDYDTIEVGNTILEFSHADETGLTISYRCYIEAIE